MLVLGITRYTDTVRIVAHLLRAALWLLPCLVALHLGQLLLAAIAWRCLVPGTRVPVAVFYRLRIAREGIDSLLPVAQVGGEIIGARLLARYDTKLSRAGASVVVDVTIELSTAVMFLMAGLASLSLVGEPSWRASWLRLLVAAATTVLGCVLALRFGLLRVLEALSMRIAQRWPRLGGVSLAGLQHAASEIYRAPGLMLSGTLLHLAAWALGSVETWGVLHAIGVRVTPAQAFVIESLGMAARSAGFAIPAALGAQEGGFVLAAAAVGVGAWPALALSLVKRLREVLVGLIGIGLWRLEAGRAVSEGAAAVRRGAGVAELAPSVAQL